MGLCSIIPRQRRGLTNDASAGINCPVVLRLHRWFPLFLTFAVSLYRPLLAVEPEVAEIVFNSSRAQATGATNGLPAWVHAIEQEDGEFLDDPPCWNVAGS